MRVSREQYGIIWLTLLSLWFCTFHIEMVVASEGNNCSTQDHLSAKGYYDPELAFLFGERIKKAVAKRDLQGLFALVEGELLRGPRKAFVLEKRFSEIYSSSWRETVIASDSPCSPMGWRGFMLANGMIWYQSTEGDEFSISSIGGGVEETVESPHHRNGWMVENNRIHARCLIRPWVSGDNYEEFAKRFGIKSYSMEALLLKHPGLFLDSEISDLTPFRPSWGGESMISLVTYLDDCSDNRVFNGRVLHLGQDCDDTCRQQLIGHASGMSYKVLLELPIAHCQKLAPHLRGKSEECLLVRTDKNTGGTLGVHSVFTVYGLFMLDSGKRAIVPLRNDHSKNEALNFVDELPGWQPPG